MPVGLSRLEFALLVHLANNPTRVYTKEELLRGVWGINAEVQTKTMDTCASRLRCKLARAGAEGWVSAIWGVGYRLAPASLNRDEGDILTSASCKAPTSP
jgi:two-component system response regulator ResD